MGRFAQGAEADYPCGLRHRGRGELCVSDGQRECGHVGIGVRSCADADEGGERADFRLAGHHIGLAFQLGCCIEGSEARLADNRQLGHDFGLARFLGLAVEGRAERVCDAVADGFGSGCTDTDIRRCSLFTQIFLHGC